jgi:putative endopeptidase
MGSTIGHELTHGFDDQGRQFDKDGNLKNWWTKEDERKFNERADCMVKQYDAIEAVPGVHLNGKLTLGENLADLGGLWLAWLAWLDKAEAAHLDMNAKTGGYTPDQRFWIAYAQQWCTQTRPEQLRTQAQRSARAGRVPDQHRADGSAGVRQELQLQEDRAMVAPKPCRSQFAGCGDVGAVCT